MRLARVLVLVLLLSPVAVSAQAPTFQEIEESLTCQCGCGLTVHSCNHLQCPSAIPLRQELREQLALDKGRDGVLAHFAEKYGEKILSSPTTTGFNLAAWVTPFVALFLGAGFVVFTLLRWRRSPRRPQPPVAVPSPPEAGAASPYEKVLERELREFE
jgi:cytochrome c-type biogenesis protein CcmH/NrfF